MEPKKLQAISKTREPVVDKAWGITRNPMQGIWHASITKGGKSSVHVHTKTQNGLYLVSGKLKVQVTGGSFVLEAGETLVVPENTWHQFEALENCELIEVYAGGEFDIIRRGEHAPVADRKDSVAGEGGSVTGV